MQVNDTYDRLYGSKAGCILMRSVKQHVAALGLGLAVSLTSFSSCSAAEMQQADTLPAADTARVYAPEIHYMLSKEGTGIYHDFWNTVMGPQDKPPLHIVPYLRSAHILRHDNGACRYPTDKGIISVQKEKDGFVYNTLIWSEGFFTSTVHAFARPGMKPPATIGDFQGRSIVVPVGYTAPPELEEQNNVILNVASEHQRATMLMSGRVDLMIASMPSAKFVMESLGVTTLPYDPNLTLKTFSLRLVCHDTPLNRQLITKFNKGLMTARKRGDIKSIYARYNLSPEP